LPAPSPGQIYARVSPKKHPKTRPNPEIAGLVAEKGLKTADFAVLLGFCGILPGLYATQARFYIAQNLINGVKNPDCASPNPGYASQNLDAHPNNLVWEENNPDREAQNLNREARNLVCA